MGSGSSSQKDQSASGLNILSKLKCLPSKECVNSKRNLKIQTIKKQFVITNTSNKESGNQCYLYPELDPSKMYVIQLSLNNQSDVLPKFYFGLLSPMIKDDFFMFEVPNFLSIPYYFEADGGRCNRVMKGERLHSNGQQHIGIKTFEFRIHLENQIFQISCPPNYQNVVELDQKEKIQNMKTLFAIGIDSPGDTVTVESVLVVNSFKDYA